MMNVKTKMHKNINIYKIEIKSIINGTYKKNFQIQNSLLFLENNRINKKEQKGDVQLELFN